MDRKTKVQGGSLSSKVQGKAMKVLPDKAMTAFHQGPTPAVRGHSP